MKTSGGAKRRLLCAGALCLSALAAPAVSSAASAADLLYERTVMTAADARCRLFTPEIRAALLAARAQARGAALRGGADPFQLDQIQARAAQKVGAVACNSPDVRKAAGRVRDAFQGFARLYRITYPGDVASWRAERIAPAEGAGWRLAQSTRIGADQATFGLSGRRGEVPQLSVSASFAGGATPYSARLVMRDPARSARPSLGGARGGPTARLPLSSRVSPRSATRQFMASSRGTDASLSPAPGRPAVVFRFPGSAAAALAGLDPREAVGVEFLFPSAGREQFRTALFEVGDFAAGQAFLAAGR
jgi:hypothetical protein